MEKITKEELQKKVFGAQLNDEELEKIAGGGNEEWCKAYCNDAKAKGKVSSAVLCIAACMNG